MLHFPPNSSNSQWIWTELASAEPKNRVSAKVQPPESVTKNCPSFQRTSQGVGRVPLKCPSQKSHLVPCRPSDPESHRETLPPAKGTGRLFDLSLRRTRGSAGGNQLVALEHVSIGQEIIRGTVPVEQQVIIYLRINPGPSTAAYQVAILLLPQGQPLYICCGIWVIVMVVKNCTQPVCGLMPAF